MKKCYLAESLNSILAPIEIDKWHDNIKANQKKYESMFLVQQ